MLLFKFKLVILKYFIILIILIFFLIIVILILLYINIKNRNEEFNYEKFTNNIKEKINKGTAANLNKGIENAQIISNEIEEKASKMCKKKKSQPIPKPKLKPKSKEEVPVCKKEKSDEEKDLIKKCVKNLKKKKCNYDNYIHKSQLSNYILKTQIPPCRQPNLNEYIKKSEIPPCPPKIDLDKYVLKSDYNKLKMKLIEQEEKCSKIEKKNKEDNNKNNSNKKNNSNNLKNKINGFNSIENQFTNFDCFKDKNMEQFGNIFDNKFTSILINLCII